MPMSSLYMECHETETKGNGKVTIHNKFYELKDNDDGTLTARFGKIGKNGKPTEGRTQTYPIIDWQVLISKRKDHGYKIVDKTVVSNFSKQKQKVDIVIGLMANNNKLTTVERAKIETISENMQKTGMLLSKQEMIFFNEVYLKVK